MRPEHAALAREWKRLSRAATVVAVLTSPALLLTFITVNDWPLIWALVATFFAVVAFRGLIDVVAHRLIPRPSLWGSGETERAEDAMQRRRRWWWRGKFRLLAWIVVGGFLTLVAMNMLLRIFGQKAGLFETIPMLRDLLASAGPSLIILGLQLPLFMLFNFLILFAPMLLFGIMQMKAYEPGDADWGVRLEDVRGQKEPKQDVERIIQLWQSGEDFRKAGGKPERGLLLIGAPGTGKTMLSKAIATSFNSPIMTMPGSGFAATFIGMDVATVLVLIWRAKRQAKKWGGQCMIFIDEIDAVGMRRSALGSGAGAMTPPQRYEDLAFWGPMGALTSSQDLILETRSWRERMFANRKEGPLAPSAGRNPRAGVVARAHVRQPQGGAAAGLPAGHPARGRADQRLHLPRRHGRHGRRLARAQPAARADGRHGQPAVHAQVLHQADQHVPRRDVRDPAEGRQGLAAGSPAQAAQGAAVLHRRDERPDRRARPGAHPPGAPWPPHLVPDADGQRSQGHLRPVPGQGRPRGTPRHREAPRRARAHH